MEIIRNMGMEVASILSRVAREKAREIQVPMVIAFADARGELVHFQRMDKALPVSTDIAMNKAFTAAALRMPTHEAAPLTQPGQPLYGLEVTNQGRLVVFGGGYPLGTGTGVMGAVGISGGSVDQDMVVAQAVVTAFNEMKQVACVLETTLPDKTHPGDFAKEVAAKNQINGISPVILEGALYLMTIKTE